MARGECPSCLERYDVTDHVPMVSIACGHGICADCADNLLPHMRTKRGAIPRHRHSDDDDDDEDEDVVRVLSGDSVGLSGNSSVSDIESSALAGHTHDGSSHIFELHNRSTGGSSLQRENLDSFHQDHSEGTSTPAISGPPSRPRCPTCNVVMTGFVKNFELLKTLQEPNADGPKESTHGRDSTVSAGSRSPEREIHHASKASADAEVARLEAERNEEAQASAARAALAAQVCDADHVIDYGQLSFSRNTASELGTGSSGIVYRGLYGVRNVAIKCVRPALSSAAYNIGIGRSALSANDERFRRELRLISRLRDQHIVEFVGAAWDEAREGGEARSLLLVTELMPGGNLKSALTALPNAVGLEVHSFLRVAIQIAKGLVYLHAEGLAHRDIKSANILLSERLEQNSNMFPEDIRAKIADFGLSKYIDQVTGGAGRQQSVMEPGRLEATYAYLAPEAFGGDKANTIRTEDEDDVRFVETAKKRDIYALGVLFWEMLTGRIPWAGVSLPDVYVRVCVRSDRPAPPLEEPQVPKTLRRLVERCWSQDAKSRPSASSIVDKLERIQARLTVAVSTGEAGQPSGQSGTSSITVYPQGIDSPPGALVHSKSIAPPGVSNNTKVRPGMRAPGAGIPHSQSDRKLLSSLAARQREGMPEEKSYKVVVANAEDPDDLGLTQPSQTHVTSIVNEGKCTTASSNGGAAGDAKGFAQARSIFESPRTDLVGVRPAPQLEKGRHLMREVHVAPGDRDVESSRPWVQHDMDAQVLVSSRSAHTGLSEQRVGPESNGSDSSGLKFLGNATRRKSRESGSRARSFGRNHSETRNSSTPSRAEYSGVASILLASREDSRNPKISAESAGAESRRRAMNGDRYMDQIDETRTRQGHVSRDGGWPHSNEGDRKKNGARRRVVRAAANFVRSPSYGGPATTSGDLTGGTDAGESAARGQSRFVAVGGRPTGPRLARMASVDESIPPSEFNHSGNNEDFSPGGPPVGLGETEDESQGLKVDEMSTSELLVALTKRDRALQLAALGLGAIQSSKHQGSEEVVRNSCALLHRITAPTGSSPNDVSAKQQLSVRTFLQSRECILTLLALIKNPTMQPHSIVSYALLTIGNLTAWNLESHKQFNGNNGVTYVVNCMSKLPRNMGIQEKCCYALACSSASFSSRAKSVFLSSGAIDKTVVALEASLEQPGCDATTKQACAALGAMCANCPSNAARAADQGGLALLVRSFDTFRHASRFEGGKRSEMHLVCNAFMNLMICEGNRKDAGGKGGSSLLLRSMRIFRLDSDLIEKCLLTMAEFCEVKANSVQIVQANGVDDIIASMIRFKTAPIVQQFGARTLCLLMRASGDSARRRVVQSGGAETLIFALERFGSIDDNAKVAIAVEGCKAIKGMCAMESLEESEILFKRMKKLRTDRTIKLVMQSHRGNTLVQERGKEALRSLSSLKSSGGWLSRRKQKQGSK